MDQRITLIILAISVLAIVIPIAVVLLRYRYFLIGVLTAEINFRSVRTLFSYLSERTVSKSITLEVEQDGTKIKIEARSPKDMEQQLQHIEKFLNAIKEDK
ncbi:MAG: DHH family phosphoesterase [Bacteroidota bacterium]